MTIISSFETDKSDLLYKRFASLASSYFDQPAVAKSPSAQVPLENLFRLLEMFRYDAFSDESRRGVLATENIGERGIRYGFKDSWHTEIECALREAMAEIFGQQVSKEEVVTELQSSLRWLVESGEIEPYRVNRAKGFFTSFLNHLEHR
ncbi:MAG: hypothetical protein EPN55_06160 [Gammaproteobacteria bacterium]|nr:MAG: hypothetical protein EPN55_06160 [Gammaproteobacteria bacterium]